MKWWRKKNKRKFISTIEQQRAEKLAELGDLLRRHRQEQALALDEVAAKTRIQQRLLQAIEEGKLFYALTDSCNHRRRPREVGFRRRSRDVEVDVTHQVAMLCKAESRSELMFFAAKDSTEGRRHRRGDR